MENNICIFIITHGRPESILTLKTLSEAGSKLPYYLVIDNEDKQEQKYFDKYKENVLQFDKKQYALQVDNFDNSGNYRTTTHARNACFDFAEKLGFENFLVLDDDYTEFKFRIKKGLVHPKDRFKIKKDIDKVFLKTMEYYLSSNFASICFSQGGD